jgi:intracellular sulfur oxidation DsrE/DsrF family protein
MMGRMRPRFIVVAVLLITVAMAALSALSSVASLALAAVPASATVAPVGPVRGPLVPDFGPSYVVPNPGLATPMLQELKVRFDVAASPAEVAAINPQLEAAARFLNMHAKAGVSPERLKVALVVHGQAGKDVLTSDAYRARHGIDNPNVPLLVALKKVGVRIYLCGQTAGTRGFAPHELEPPARMALSAMTAHLVLNSEGYVLNPF